MDADEFSEHLLVLVIGVDEILGDELPRLLSPEKDAQGIANALLLKTGCALKEQNLILLTGKEATKHACMAALDTLAVRSTAEDLILIYFAGHGLRGQADFFLCNSGADSRDLQGTAISGTDLNQSLERLSARGALVILDCCKGAAFAELSPNFFRSAGTSDFKILLSASRANELSWERPAGQGTLFSQHLLDVIEGKQVVGNTPGLVYFTELLAFIQNQLKEDFETAYQHLPVQEPVFIGTYALDPLLFVHRGLTLRQVKVKTRRYSREYIRRLVRSWLLGLSITLLFLAGFLYAVLDNYSFVSFAGSKIIGYKGLSGFQVFGFPKSIWQYPYLPADFKPSSNLSNGKAVSGSLGETSDEIVYSQLRQVYQAEIDIRKGFAGHGRQLLYTSLQTKDPPVLDDKILGLMLLNDVSHPEDTVLFNSYAADQSDQVRSLAITGIFKYIDTKGHDLAVKDRGLHATGVMIAGSLNNYVAASLDGCHPGDRAYLEFLLTLPYDFTRKLALADFYRGGCDLPDSAMLNIFKHMGGDDWDEDLTNYYFLLGLQQRTSLTGSLAARLAVTMDPVERKYLLKILYRLHYQLDQTLCIHLMGSQDPNVQYLALLRYLEREPFPVAYGWGSVLKQNPQCLVLEAKFHVIPVQELIDSLQTTSFVKQDYILDGIELLESAQRDTVMNALVSVALDDNTYYLIKQKIIHLLARFHYPSDRAGPLFTADNVSIQNEAFLWYGDSHHQWVIDTVFNRREKIDPDLLYPLFKDIGLNRKQIALLRSSVSSNSIPSASNVCLLAAFGDVDDLESLFLHPDYTIRAMAAKYGLINPHVKDWLRKHPATGYPYNETIQKIQTQCAVAISLIAEIKKVHPTLRQWYLKQMENVFEFRNNGEFSLSKGAVWCIEKDLDL